jgi:mercuric ion transport protein
MEIHEAKSCHCQSVQDQAATFSGQAAKKTARSMYSAFLGLLIAFFPKCPICWAAYMSMFGSVGLANAPYMGWLFPVLLGFLGLHLVLLLKKAPQKGYGPFSLSLAGALLILLGRGFLSSAEWIPPAGMLFILSGSLWNSFSVKPLKTSIQL